jgi:hypothetical protein
MGEARAQPALCVRLIALLYFYCAKSSFFEATANSDIEAA